MHLPRPHGNGRRDSRCRPAPVGAEPGLESRVGILKRVEWQFIYPPDSRERTVTIAWTAYLADEFGDSLVRLVLEAPEPDWAEVKAVAGDLMTNVRRIRPGAETSADERGQQ